MISVAIHLTDLHDRMDTAVRLIDETHPAGPGASGPIAREARGLAVVLLFAAYENLLKSLTRTLLEGAVRCRVSNARLQPGFRAFAITAATQSARALPKDDMYTKILPGLIAVTSQGGRQCTINTSAFPDDGSFMRSSQVVLWCKVFNVGDPKRLFRATWPTIDAVVSDRNAIAHGELTPDVIGRRYTEAEIRKLIRDWRNGWDAFLKHVEVLGANRDFFRTP